MFELFVSGLFYVNGIQFVWGLSILKGFELQPLVGSNIKSLIGLAEHIKQQSIALYYNNADDKLSSVL